MTDSVLFIIYAIQIAFLLACIYMTWRARRALNSLGRGLVLLFVLLIARRVNDMLGYLDTIGVLLLSSAVVIVVTYDIYQIYKVRDMYAFYLRNRQERIEKLESMRDWNIIESTRNFDT